MARRPSPFINAHERCASLWEASCREHQVLLADPVTGPYLLDFATPVLAFGRWETASVVTAGLNPSEREFCETGGGELAPANRRLAHRSPQSLSHGDLPIVMSAAASYFETPNAYWTWFGGFGPLLDSLGADYAAGSACHTDYLSPYATAKGAGSVPARVIRVLERPGLSLWKAVIETLPAVQVIIGIGRGWRLMPDTLGFRKWMPVETPFDNKGSISTIRPPYLLEQVVAIAGRKVFLFWWKPNRGEPLSWLGTDEKSALGTILQARMK